MVSKFMLKSHVWGGTLFGFAWIQAVLGPLSEVVGLNFANGQHVGGGQEQMSEHKG